MDQVRKILLCLLSALLLYPSVSFAQFEGDDVYDPFADYSEFEENAQEEADIHFFRNGRFFNFAFLVGYRAFTNEMGEYIEPNISPGLYVAYFFNLRMAIQLSYTFSQHRMEILDPRTPAQFNDVVGNVAYSRLNLNFKYYFNTQNVTRGLADLNPYITGGFGFNFRTFTVQGSNLSAKENASGFNIGAGIEIPIADNEMYLGIQVNYQNVDFPSENQEWQDDVGNNTGVFLTGDEVTIFPFLGVNF